MSSPKKKRLLFSAFTGNGPGNGNAPGLWRYQGYGSFDYRALRDWIDLAALLEDARFDMLFLADSIGVYESYRNSREPAIRHGISVPANDPMVLLAALAGVTGNLGLAFTSAPVQAHPFDFARKVTAFDQLSSGRVGWNIVTGYSANGARNFGLDALLPHDTRYRQVEEYVSVLYKLWEKSWDDDAMVLDAAANVFCDPRGVRNIDHRGEYYAVTGPFSSAPSPQRTPLLIQAGTSPVGRDFAAKHAEAVFLLAPGIKAARQQIADIRARTAGFGRRPDDIRFLQGLWFVVGETEADAKARHKEILDLVDIEAALVDRSGKLGFDLDTIDIDQPLKELAVEGVRGTLLGLINNAPEKVSTFRDLALLLINSCIVGTPDQIADELEKWRDEGDIDGVNVMSIPSEAGYRSFIELAVPVLRERGLIQDAYREGTLRQKIFGEAAHLPERHSARK